MTELEKAARQARGYLNGLIRGLRMGDDSEAAKVLAAIDIALEQQQPDAPVVDDSAAKRICTVLGWKPATQPPQFPVALRKMWSGAEVQAWIDENWNKP